MEVDVRTTGQILPFLSHSINHIGRSGGERGCTVGAKDTEKMLTCSSEAAAGLAAALRLSYTPASPGPAGLRVAPPLQHTPSHAGIHPLNSDRAGKNSSPDFVCIFIRSALPYCRPRVSPSGGHEMPVKRGAGGREGRARCAPSPRVFQPATTPTCIGMCSSAVRLRPSVLKLWLGPAGPSRQIQNLPSLPSPLVRPVVK
uniref:Uncharacterized protein n=1 Tax=Branchiostoma floridae TaxID=7739 RepID=C3Y687_BRAFL|eukprot:XP_002608474.1 hypothetical protein BRAFLDRAFT_96610 [Branchiostoma floridae]